MNNLTVKEVSMNDKIVDKDFDDYETDIRLINSRRKHTVITEEYTEALYED